MAAALKAHVRSMCAYSAWANSRLHSAIKTIPSYQLRAQDDNGHFAKSIQGIVAHMLAAELIWFQRLTESNDPTASIQIGQTSISFSKLSSLWGSDKPGMGNE